MPTKKERRGRSMSWRIIRSLTIYGCFRGLLRRWCLEPNFAYWAAMSRRTFSSWYRRRFISDPVSLASFRLNWQERSRFIVAFNSRIKILFRHHSRWALVRQCVTVCVISRSVNWVEMHFGMSRWEEKSTLTSTAYIIELTMFYRLWHKQSFEGSSSSSSSAI